MKYFRYKREIYKFADNGNLFKYVNKEWAQLAWEDGSKPEHSIFEDLVEDYKEIPEEEAFLEIL